MLLDVRVFVEMRILAEHRTCLERIAETLLEREVIQGSELDEMLRRELGTDAHKKEPVTSLT
jgi:hypothetical protein